MLFLLMFLVSCANHHYEPETPSFSVKVDSISVTSDKPSFVVLSDMKDVSSEDLRFKKHAEIVSAALEKSGFTRGNGARPDIIVKLKYSVSEPRKEFQSISSTNTTYNWHTKRNEFTGSHNTVIDHDMYVRTITLRAINKRNQEVWTTELRSEGSNSNITEVFPFIVSAGIGHYGSSHVQEVEVPKTPESISYLRNPASVE